MEPRSGLASGVIFAAALAVLAVDVLVASEQREALNPPAFDRGGEWTATASPAREAETTPTPAASPDTPAPTSPPPSTPSAAEDVSPAPAPAQVAGDHDPATQASAEEASAAEPARPPRTPAARTPREASSPPRLAAPAPGEYRYDLEGWEQTSAPGSRRQFPSSARVRVHSVGDSGGATAFTVDLTYIPERHEERLVFRADGRGLAVTFEGGKVVFFNGAVTETSQAVYHPPVLRAAYPSRQGATWHGTSAARDPRSGDVVRRERYSGKVVGWETLRVAGRAVRTLVVEWESRFTGSESGWRRQRIWLSPELGMWVKLSDRVHGERLRFAYDKQATLTLRSLP